jgi:glucosamine--fructose-6-phosphate aminotransferase (isomerizing)
VCGIVGFNGKKDSVNIIIEGLKTLEYRGYDSAGIAVKTADDIVIIKSTGRVQLLEDKIDKFKKSFDLNGTLGIGHTRWATHGEPSEANSHPHSIGDITIVHNGIIENYKELKEKLINCGYFFKSQTDTEVACALIDYYYNDSHDILKSLSMFMDKVKGSYAIAAIVNNDDNLYCVRKDAPLIIANGKDGNYIASDIIAIGKLADKVIFLDDGIIAKVGKKEISLFNKDLNKIKPEFKDMPESAFNTDKGGYDHFMLKEIHEQPRVFKDTTDSYISDDSICNMPDFDKYNKIHVVACGSAYHTGLVGKNLIEEYANIPVTVEVASEYRYKKNFYDKDTLVIVVSQSGETADTLAALRKAKSDHVDTLAIVNVPNSSIAREADHVLLVKAGPEVAVATTKAYSAQVATFGIIALNIGVDKGVISKEDYVNILKEIREMPVLIENIINNKEYKEIAKAIYERDDIFFIGRGIDYDLCQEGSLKLKEISYIHSQAYAAGELKHGTISLVCDGTPVIGIITDDLLKDKTISNIQEVKSRGAKCVIISNDDSINGYDYTIVIPKVHKILQPLLTVLPLQLISYEVAKLRDCNIDKPKNLAKSVTVE